MVVVLTRRVDPAPLILVALLAVAHRDVHAQPLAPPPPVDPNAPYDFDPSLPILVIVLVSAFFFVGFFTIYIRQCAEADDTGAATNFQDEKRSGLGPAVVGSFPVFVYSHVKELRIGKGTSLECAVCLSEFEDDDKLRLIPHCSHVFHPDCIDMWLDSHVTCPVCRAKLSPESTRVKDSPPDSNTDRPNSSIQQGLGQTQVAIDVGEDRNRGIEGLDVANPPLRSRITGKFHRSHSTGHSLVQPGECTERYTLRLPEDVRKQIDRDCRLKRTMSYQIVLTREGSSRKGNRSGGEGSSRGKSLWISSRTPPFVSRAGSVKCEKVGGGDGDGSNSGARKVLTAVIGPLGCLNGRGDQVEEASRPPAV